MTLRAGASSGAPSIRYGSGSIEVPQPFDTCYLNGQYLPLREARLSPLDRGFLFADGVYEVVPVHRGRPFRLREHLQRLERSLAGIRLADPLSGPDWAAIITELVRQAGAPEQLVYLQVTRGAEYGRNHLLPTAIQPTVFAFASPYPRPAARALDDGLATVTLADTRWQRCDIKATALLANVLLRQAAADAGADEALLVADEEVREGSSSTLLVVLNGRLRVRPDDEHILAGTTRDVAIELAAEFLPVEILPISVAELLAATEVWIASAGRGILPVTRIDGRPIGDGRPGTLWRRVYRKLQEHLDAIAGLPPI
jgi:D-alanine transaminase